MYFGIYILKLIEVNKYILWPFSRGDVCPVVHYMTMMMTILVLSLDWLVTLLSHLCTSISPKDNTLISLMIPFSFGQLILIFTAYLVLLNYLVVCPRDWTTDICIGTIFDDLEYTYINHIYLLYTIVGKGLWLHMTIL